MARPALGLVKIRDVTVTPQMLAALDHLAGVTGMSRVALVRMAVAEKLVALGLMSDASDVPATPLPTRKG